MQELPHGRKVDSVTYPDEDIKEAESDALWWQAVDRLTGWRMFGFTYRHAASFVGSDGVTSINLTGKDRDAIVEVFEMGRRSALMESAQKAENLMRELRREGKKEIEGSTLRPDGP